MKTPQLKTLDNGLRVIFLPYPNISSVYISIEGLAGSNYESIDNTGVAHFLEHYLLNGSEKYPNKFEVFTVAENNGGFVNAGTGRYDVEYYGRFLKEDLELGFDLISQLVIHPLFEEKYLKHEKEIIQQEAKSRIDRPMTKHYLAQDSILYPNTRRQYLSIGRLSHIKKMKLTDLIDFYNENYNASNFILGIAGDVDARKVFDYAEKYFSDMKPGKENPIKETKRVPNSTYYVKKDKNFTQANINIKFEAPPWGDDMYASYLVSLVLGGAASSRLYKRLRLDSGFAYNVSSRYLHADTYGSFNIDVKIREKHLEPALKIIKEEINKISTELISDKEHEMAKKLRYAGYAFLLDNPPRLQHEYMFFLSKKLYPKMSPEDLLQRYLNVTKEDVLSTAQKIFSNNYHISVISSGLTKSRVKKAWEY